jgi:hypothetical protein
MKNVIELHCDESGLTGPNLLDDGQRLFTYAGASISDQEAYELLGRLRRKHMVLDDELKAKDLLKSERGRALVLDLLEAMEGRYSIVAYDKAVALCAKLVEHVYEPVFQDVPDLLYGKDLHRFITMYCHTFFVVRDELGAEAVRQFLSFMRSYDPSVAPLLFERSVTDGKMRGNPFEMITAFAKGYRDIIVADGQSERDAATNPGTLTLDLTGPALFSLLNHYGRHHDELAVTCDENRQLETLVGSFTGGDDDPGIIRARELFPNAGPFGFALARPIVFQNSRGSPGIQVADVLAGTAGACGLGRVDAKNLRRHLEAVDRHIHPQSIMPDTTVVDPKTRGSMVNWLVLQGLGERARRGQNPFFLLRELYAEAEAAWDRGELRLSSETS